MKKILKYTGVVLLFLLIPAALAFVPIGNNIILHKHTNELKRFKLNAEYKVAAVDSECGKLTGNGNGMQYFSALLIHSKEALKWENDEWGGVFLINIKDHALAEFMDENNFGGYCPNIKEKLKEIKNSENYYVLYSYDSADLNSIWNIDLRAH